jgi:EAL domain-containing protein (putative c-di-GMP-specific phosphodiesterase class I)
MPVTMPDAVPFPASPPETLLGSLDRTRRTRALVEELIADPGQLGPDVQPVRRLADDAVVAWKATGRGRPGTELAGTLALLAGAASLGLVERLDWAFRVHVLETALAAGVREPIHLTPEPETFGGACPPRLAVAFGRGRRQLAVAAEFHADALDDLLLLDSALEEYRSWGWDVVLADVADVPDAVAAVHRVRPDVVQVDLSLPHRASAPAVGRLLEAAQDVGAAVMALGVDTAVRREEALGLGATLGRGLLLGAPGPLPAAAR